MRKLMHAIAGTGALLLVSAFWLSTVASELSGSETAVVAVKTTIPFALPIMVLLMAVAGGTGLSLSVGMRFGRVAAKRRQMPFIAANGLLILIPCALFLGWRAAAGQFDTTFYAVQIVELAAGTVNILLLGFNFRDGIAMTRGWPSNKRAQTARPVGR